MAGHASQRNQGTEMLNKVFSLSIKYYPAKRQYNGLDRLHVIQKFIFAIKSLVTGHRLKKYVVGKEKKRAKASWIKFAN